MDGLTPEELKELLREVVREELFRKYDFEQENKLLSPDEVCHLFTPRISLPTLARYEKNGLVTKYRMGRRTYFKYGEVIKAVRQIKRYGHLNHLHSSDRAA